MITVGSTLTAISTNRWDLNIHNMIQFDIIPENIGRHYPAKVGVVGDAKAGLRSLIDTLKADSYQADPSYRNDIFARKAKWAESVFSGPIADVNATPVPPVALHMELSKCLKENSIFVVDAGNPGAWTHITDFPAGTTYMKPVNYGNMGFALGAALGCKEAAPDREVIALLGDGSLGMTLGELETISREKLHVIVILVNDDAYGNIKQEEKFKTGTENYIGVEFPSIDYVKVAEALGYNGTIVRKASEIPQAMEAARASDKPFMIEVKLDGSYTVWPSCF